MLWVEFGELAYSFLETIPTFSCMIITVIIVIITSDQFYVVIDFFYEQ